MTCAKRQVRCVIKVNLNLHNEGQVYVGENICGNPQVVCPRDEGEGYEKCILICRQRGHAEIEALNAAKAAGADLRGATAILMGHWNMCKNCAAALRDAGIAKIEIEVTP